MFFFFFFGLPLKQNQYRVTHMFDVCVCGQLPFTKGPTWLVERAHIEIPVSVACVVFLWPMAKATIGFKVLICESKFYGIQMGLRIEPDTYFLFKKKTQGFEL